MKEASGPGMGSSASAPQVTSGQKSTKTSQMATLVLQSGQQRPPDLQPQARSCSGRGGHGRGGTEETRGVTGRGGARRLRLKDRCAHRHWACCALPLLLPSSSAHVQLRVPLRSRHGRAHPEPAVPETAGMAPCEPRRPQPEEPF